MQTPPAAMVLVVPAIAALLTACAATPATSRDTGATAPDLRAGASLQPPAAEGSEVDRPSAAPTPSGSTALFADPVLRAMYDVIDRQRPDLRFQLAPGRPDGDWSLDGVAEDAEGLGRLFVYVTAKPGNLVPNPCTDSDFTQGGTCISRVLTNGDRLVLRGLVEFDDTRTVVVALIHPNRSGMTAEASNLVIEGRTTSVRRAMPLYTVEQLADLVLAIDRRLRN